MSKLSVTVYATMARDMGNATVPAPQVPALAEWVVEYGLESVQSPTFPQGAKFISITPSDSCCLAFGRDPEAKVGLHPVGGGETRWYGITEGHRLAVIEGAS